MGPSPDSEREQPLRYCVFDWEYDHDLPFVFDIDALDSHTDIDHKCDCMLAEHDIDIFLRENSRSD